MNKVFYPKLAAQNCLKNGRFYFPFLLTVVGSSAAFYIILALAGMRYKSELSRYAYLTEFMGIGVFVLALFSAIFLFYTNGFLMKRRCKELALYNILGMDKRNIGVVLSFETLYTWLGGVGGGIAVGMLLQRLMTMLVARLVHIDTAIVCRPAGECAFTTGAYFGALLLLTLLWNIGRVGLQKPVELLHGESLSEREPRVKWLVTLLGILSLAGGYAIALFTKTALTAMLLYFMAVFLVIIGTYCLFSSVSIAVLKLLQRKKSFYYRTGNFIGVSGMLHRMNRNAVGLANICILSTMVLVMISGTLALYIGTEDSINERFPEPFVGELRYEIDEDSFDARLAAERIKAGVEKSGLTAGEVKSYENAEINFGKNGNRYITGTDKLVNSAPERATLTITTAADYSALTGVELALGEGEAAIEGVSGGKTLEFVFESADGASEEMRYLNVGLPSDMSLFHYGAVISDRVLMVVSDRDELMRLAHAFKSCSGLSEYLVNWDCLVPSDGSAEQQVACARSVDDPDYIGISGENDFGWRWFSFESREQTRSEIYALNGGFFFLGIFLGIIFLMAAVLIIYYKQISEGYEDRERFLIMQQVGLPKAEIRRSINRQVLIVFFAPLAVSAVHVLFDFRLIRLLLTLFSLNNAALSALCTLGIFALFALIYAAVYMLTAKSYYRIVSEKNA